MYQQTSVPIVTPSFEIGRYTYYSPDLVLRTWLPFERISIGSFCSIADRVVILTGGMRRMDLAALFPFDVMRTYRSTRNTTIGHDVWVGSGAMVIGGVSVGNGAVIAAGAVVMGDVPPFAVAAGNPASVVRYRFSRPVVERLERIAWWHWLDTKLLANREWFYRPISEFVEHFDPENKHADNR